MKNSKFYSLPVKGDGLFSPKAIKFPDVLLYSYLKQTNLAWPLFKWRLITLLFYCILFLAVLKSIKIIQNIKLKQFCFLTKGQFKFWTTLWHCTDNVFHPEIVQWWYLGGSSVAKRDILSQFTKGWTHECRPHTRGLRVNFKKRVKEK